MTAKFRTFAAAAGFGLTAGLASAQTALEDLPIVGAPVDGATGFQPAASKLARDLQWLDGLILVIITAITLFVLALLAWVILRYNQKANKEPARFTHNSPLEIAWTVVPIVVLVFIGAFSLPVLFDQQEIPEGEVYVNVTGNQWFWTYEYPEEDVTFESRMIGGPSYFADGDWQSGTNRPMPDTISHLELAGYGADEFGLATDTAVVVPVGRVVVMSVTGADVIHSWTIPSFGVKQDAVPGRHAQLWFEAEQEGIYFGQCSELCGKDHAFMPITVKAVSEEVYAQWLERVRTDDAYQAW